MLLCWISVTKSKMIIEHLHLAALRYYAVLHLLVLVATVPYVVMDISDKVKNKH